MKSATFGVLRHAVGQDDQPEAAGDARMFSSKSSCSSRFADQLARASGCAWDRSGRSRHAAGSCGAARPGRSRPRCRRARTGGRPRTTPQPLLDMRPTIGGCVPGARIELADRGVVELLADVDRVVGRARRGQRRRRSVVATPLSRRPSGR